MKNKHIILGALLFLGSFASAQVNTQSQPSASINQENPFLDASGYLSYDNNVGKGLYFPKTDLTTWEFKTAGINPGKFRTYFDGMIVYNSGTGNTIADATKGGKQVSVTPGFYYFKNPNQSAPRGSVANGEWVRLGADASAFDGEWVYDDTTKQIKLKRSGTLFGNTVFYNKNGALINYDLTSYKWFNVNNGTTPTETLDFANYLGNALYRKTSSINFGTSKNYDMNEEVLYVDSTTSADMNMLGRSSSIYISPDNTKNYQIVRGIKGEATHYGSGNAKYLHGGYFDARLERGYSDGYVYGLRATASYGTNQTSKQQTAVGVFNVVAKSAGGTIENMIDFDAYKSFANSSPLAVTNMKGFYAKNNLVAATGKVSITNARGFDYDGLDLTGSTHTVENNYGLHIGNIAGGTASNYAIYTNKGQVRVGDLADASAATDRTIVVDKNGVLKVGTASGTTATKVGTTTGVECKEDNRGTMNFGRITINGKATDAIGFCMKNGDNEFRWYYIYGGAAHTVGTSAVFGSGL